MAVLTTEYMLLQSVAVSGGASVSGNNLVGKVELDYFSFDLKWSDIGELHTSIVQVIWPLLYVFFLSFSCSSFLSPNGRALNLHANAPFSKIQHGKFITQMIGMR
jgi:hypothetical protein